MRRPFQDISDAEFQSAEMIDVTSTQDARFDLVAWGQDSPGASVMPGAPAHIAKQLLVSISSPADLQSLLKAILRLKGRLPNDVTHLLTT